MGFTWITPDPMTAGTQKLATHINELKDNLDTIYTTLGYDYSTPACGAEWSGFWDLTGATQVLASHHNEVRDRADFLQEQDLCSVHFADDHGTHYGTHHPSYDGTDHPAHCNGDNISELSPNHDAYHGTDLFDKNPYHVTHLAGNDTGYNLSHMGNYHSNYHVSDHGADHGAYDGTEHANYDNVDNIGVQLVAYSTVS